LTRATSAWHENQRFKNRSVPPTSPAPHRTALVPPAQPRPAPPGRALPSAPFPRGSILDADLEWAPRAGQGGA
jgi:hypothetical protein